MHIVALLIESRGNTAIAATQISEQTKRHPLYSSRMTQQRGFRQRNCCTALANREKNALRVTRPMFNRVVVQVSRSELVETSSSSCLVI